MGSSSHKERDDLGSPPHGKPVAEVENNAREKSGFRNAKQKTKNIETDFALDERENRRDYPPGNHDTRDPKTRAYLLKDDVGRYLKQEIAEKKDARTKPKDRGSEAQVLVHRERREADIDAVDVGYEIEQHDKRDDAQRYLAQCPSFQFADHWRLRSLNSFL